MKLYDLCEDLRIPLNCADREISAVVTDSRRACPGCLFICLRGGNDDGHKYIAGAMRAGAAAILTESGAVIEITFGSGSAEGGDSSAVCFLETEDTRAAAALIWNNYYGRPADKLAVIAVTGTNGKTSVTHMLDGIFSAAGYKTGLIGTVKCTIAGKVIETDNPRGLANMTTPDPEELYKILHKMAAAEVDYVFIEATSHALALRKLEPIRPVLGIFTNLTPDHLDFHGDMENYLAAKSRLFHKCGRALINAADAYADRIIDAAMCKLALFYTGESGGFPDGKRIVSDKVTSVYRAAGERSLGAEGIEYTLHSDSAAHKIRCRIPGEFTVKNTLAAAAAALETGIHPDYIREALRVMPGVEGRIERVSFDVPVDFSVFIDYAHTPDALENLLLTARGFGGADRRIIILFGCGGDRDRGKRRVMGSIASRLADFVIVTSDNSRGEEPGEIIAEILSGMDRERPHIAIENRAVAIEYAIREARQGDIILLAGKGHENYEINRDGRQTFNEREIVRRAVKSRSG